MMPQGTNKEMLQPARIAWYLTPTPQGKWHIAGRESVRESNELLSAISDVQKPLQILVMLFTVPTDSVKNAVSLETENVKC